MKIIFASFVLFAVTAFFQVYDVTCWRFVTDNKPYGLEVSYGKGVTNATFLCQADTPLRKCQFTVYSRNLNMIYEMDLKEGSVKSRGRERNPLRFNVTYYSDGLKKGQCGATFSNITAPWLHYACRGADEKGEWHTMNFDIPGRMEGGMPYTRITPRQVTVMPGANVSVILSTYEALAECFVTVGIRSVTLYKFSEDDNRLPTDQNRYYGSGLSRGDCGITLMNVSKDDNGPLTIMGAAAGNEGRVERHSDLIVVSPPTETYFSVDKLHFSVGDTLKATCLSLFSRPVANLTWTLDDRIIRQDGISDEFQEDVWSWPWDKKNITQTLSHEIEEEHFGKMLECRIEHPALIENHRQLITRRPK